jgi:putative NADPH-quinone reductase
MNVLVVYAHPDPCSFVAAVRDIVVETLTRNGHRVDLVDLAADGFDARLSEDEWLGQKSGAALPPEIGDYADRLKAAEALVFVYPTWWSGPPALLKGWLERVFVTGVAYDVSGPSTRLRGRLQGIRRVSVVTTHGSPRAVNTLQGPTGRRLFLRQVRALCGLRVRTSWVALYNVDSSDEPSRTAFLKRVEQSFARW